MATLNSLPSEVLAEILANLPADDLARTSLVSRHLHEISLPLLYRAPDLCSTGPRTNRSSIEIFLWTILTPNREELATHVRSLSCRWSNSRSGRRCPTENALLDTSAKRFGLRSSFDSQGSLFVLLIHLLPRLRVIKMIPPVHFPTFNKLMELRYNVLTNPAASPTLPLVLQSLREFHSPPPSVRRSISEKTLMMLLLLPCISHIDVIVAQTDRSSLHAMEGVPASSTVTKLRLADPSNFASYLSFILRAPTALTHFSYNTVYRRSNFDLHGFWESMRPLRESVIYLELDLWLGTGDPVPGLSQNDADWSLREWCVLRTLSCPLAALLGKQRAGIFASLVGFLPVGIRQLEIKEDDHWPYAAVVDKVVDLLDQKIAVVPMLERVAIKAAVEADLGALEKLRGACEAADVTVVDASFRW